jgi:effector-binding domain-containing protein
MSPRTLWFMSVVLACCTVASAQTRPSTQPDFTLGPVRQQHLVGVNFLYTTCKATIRTIADVAGAEVPKLFDAIKEANIQQRGPVIFIYRNLTDNLDAPFDVQIGMAVEDNVVPPTGYQSIQLSPSDCATILYTGSMANIGQAYATLMPAAWSYERKPTGETREYYLYFEDDKSPNNVVLIATVLK